MCAKMKAAIDGLYRVPEHGKAELINEELVRMAPTDSPDAAFYLGTLSMKFLEGAPVFAAEVRSEGDYGPIAEQEMAAKRADYFAAGTLLVWDVDIRDEQTVRVYRADAPKQPTLYRRGEVAEAEPAVPGWRMPVDDLFPPDLPEPSI